MAHLGPAFYTDDELRAVGFKSLGENVKIGKSAALYFVENISIGDNSRIDNFTVLVASGRPVVIGQHVHISSHCYVVGSAGFEMQDFSGLSPGCLLFTHSDDYKGGKLTNPTIPRFMTGGVGGKITIERHAILGAGTVVHPNITIGEGASVGSNSLVNRNLDPWSIYFGTPAKKHSARRRDLILEQEKVLLNQPQSLPCQDDYRIRANG